MRPIWRGCIYILFIHIYPLGEMCIRDSVQPSPQLSAAAPAATEVYYPTTTTVRTEEGRETVEGFCVLPEDWADSMY